MGVGARLSALGGRLVAVAGRLTAFAARRLGDRRFILAGLAAFVALALWVRLGPLPDGLLEAVDAPSTIVVDRHGEVLYESRTARGTRGDRMAGAVPPLVAQATLAAEDVRFRSHPGVDPLAIARALWHDLRAGRIVEGGSTITQQVVQLLRARQHAGRAPRGWRAQLEEAVIALRLEHHRSKDEILALYLALAPYGNQIEGAARAAEAYFGRTLDTLTPAEAAYLAALPNRPGRFNPWRDPAAAVPRQQRILRTMAARGWISSGVLAEARAERVAFEPSSAPFVAPHFVERVLADVEAGAAARIETTLDAGLQRTVRGIIAAHHADLDAHHAANVAVVVLDNRTGGWLAWEGSGAYGDASHGGAIDGVIAPRQPGSALKPFTYAAAFERDAHPARVLADVPSQFPTAEPGILYSPRNYDDRYRGPLRARLALAGSENVPAVALASSIGVPALARFLRQMGFSTLDHDASYYGLGLTLGNAEVRLDELVAAYAAFARGGVAVDPARVTAVDGHPVPRRSGARRVMAERTAFWITDILSDPEARAWVFGYGGSLTLPFQVAAKTGTSQAYHDNWTVGYTRDVTVGVWVGNFDRTPLRQSSGVTGAGPIFHDVMLAAVELVRGPGAIGDDTPIARPPGDVERVEVCALSGLAPNEACPVRVAEWLPSGLDLDRCTWHHATTSGDRVTVLPDAYRQWARMDDHAGMLLDAGIGTTAFDAEPSVAGSPDPARPAASGTPTPAAPEAGLRIVAPLAGALYLLDPTLRREFQALPLRAAGAAPGELEWFVDDERVARGAADGTARWPLARGTHHVRVRDASGREAVTRITVR
ncbi:MAG: penicillin-binding protein 1C [Vicinamibacterales bacterium]